MHTASFEEDRKPKPKDTDNKGWYYFKYIIHRKWQKPYVLYGEAGIHGYLVTGEGKEAPDRYVSFLRNKEREHRNKLMKQELRTLIQKREEL